MADASNAAFQASTDLSLWFKLRGGDALVLADMPSIIPLRWTYFRDNWGFIKARVLSAAPKYDNPDFLYDSIKTFSDFIDKQRNQPNINPFSDSLTFYKFFAIFDNVLIESINLTNDEKTIIKNRSTTVNSYSKNDFIRIKQNLIDYRDRLADLGGLGDASYNSAVDRSSIPQQTTASILDLNMMAKLQDDIGVVDFVLANLFAIDTAVDPFALARANAKNPDIDIGQYASGRLVKMEYGEDLEGLANRYFKDSNKWIDIAIANGLKPPYIDEVGQKLLMIANGNGNQVNIGQTDVNGNLNLEKFYINQVVVLQSNIQLFPDQRTVIGIREIPVSGEIVLQLSGEPNLDVYKLVDKANVRVFLPNTINSSFFILIPSTKPLSNPRNEELPWFLSKAAEDEKRAKVDLAIDDSGEIQFGTSGDFNLSYGLANDIQAIKLKMMTELGSLRYHPEFGLANVVGSKNDKLSDVKSILTDSITNQIQIDPRFDRIENLDIRYAVGSSSGSVGAIQIILSVRLAGSGTVVPISFTVTK